MCFSRQTCSLPMIHSSLIKLDRYLSIRHEAENIHFPQRSYLRQDLPAANQQTEWTRAVLTELFSVFRPAI